MNGLVDNVRLFSTELRNQKNVDSIFHHHFLNTDISLKIVNTALKIVVFNRYNVFEAISVAR